VGILEDLLARLDSLDDKVENLIAIADGPGEVVAEPKPAKKKAAKKKAAAKKDDELELPSFLASVKVLAKENKEAVKAARDELFDSSMKLRDVPAEERQNFIDRVEALIEEDDLS